MTKLVVGLGETGQSVLRYFERKGVSAISFDTRTPSLFSWEGVDEVIVSPGLALDTEILVEARKRKLPIIGDIELFYRETKIPIIAITGTNAKSTVTTLVTEMINATGKKALMGGNIGIPALDLLTKPMPDYYVLELSSFQLDLVDHFEAFVAIVLNVTPDHLDRHGSMEAYRAAKMRIYKNCPYPIKNQGVGRIPCQLSPGLSGEHNLENARNALAILAPLNLPLEPQLEVLRTFKGLPHRCEFVRELDDVTWINDSKGTNVGATLAAIEGIKGSIILLLGGVAKDQDFAPLIPAIKKYVKQVLIYGQDRLQIAQDLQGMPFEVLTSDFKSILERAKAVAQSGDVVLLSPACASLDMFKNFADRGDQFARIVQAF